MWKFFIKLLPPIIYIASTIYTYFKIKFHITKKNFNKAMEIYNNKLIENLTDNGVYQYIVNISKLPKTSYKQLKSDNIKEIYKTVIDSKNINEDLKAQLRVTLKLNGFDVA